MESIFNISLWAKSRPLDGNGWDYLLQRKGKQTHERDVCSGPYIGSSLEECVWCDCDQSVAVSQLSLNVLWKNLWPEAQYDR